MSYNLLAPYQPQFNRKFNPLFWLLVLATILILIGIVGAEEIGYASWYSVESCKREGTSGIMANGKELKDDEFTCASWQFPFGTLLRITNVHTGRYCLARVTDRGPAKRLVKKGRIIDLSKRAFAQIADLKSGIIQVKIERLK